jgi:ribonuclease P protein component
MGLLYRNNGLQHNRVLFTTRRGFGGSVARNRVRRIGRETYRCLKAEMARGYDLAFVFYPGPYAPADRRVQIESLLVEVGLLTETKSP